MPGRTLHMLQTVASGFGDWIGKVVFIGGAVLEHYLTDPAAPACRPTEDLDCLINAPGQAFVYEWDSYLQKRDFRKLKQEGELAFYWEYQGIRIHLLPPYPEMVGFENRWFEEGLFHARYISLPSGLKVRMFTPVYFLATKLEALRHRGWDNLRLSEDFEDIMLLVAHRPELFDEVSKAFHEVRTSIQGHLQELLAHPELEEGLYNTLPYEAGPEYIAQLIYTVRKLAGLQEGVAFKMAS